MSAPCILPQATLAFFPGTKGDPGPEGAPGPASTVPGPAGATGGIAVYTHSYDPTATYYDTAVRKDIVAYNGIFWVVANPGKSGSNNWSAPNVADWEPFGVPIPIVATKLALLYPSSIAFPFTFTGTAFQQSSNFVQYLTGWLLTAAGRVEINDGLFIGAISTDSERFHQESPNRTMPSVGYNELEIPAQADIDIPVNPLVLNVPSNDTDMVFFGWTQGPNTYIENRFGNGAQKFDIFLEGTGENNAAGTDLFYIQVYYRTRDNGGAWGAWTPIGHDTYVQVMYGIPQSFNIAKTLSIALTGTEDIQFSAGFSKGAGGVAQVNGAKLSVEAYN